MKAVKESTHRTARVRSRPAGDSPQDWTQPPQLCVLFIEDSEDEMLLVKYALEECGSGVYTLEWENTLSQGRERLRKGGIDVVLLDLGLPGHSGPSSFLSLRSAAPELPIVVLTSDEREQTELSVMTGGAEDFLIKEEISPDHLLHAIRGAISRRRYRVRSHEHPSASGRRGHTIAFVGAKGGVGATTTILNLAAALAPAGPTIAIETVVGRSGFAQQIQPERAASLPPSGPEAASAGLSELLSPTCFGAAVMFEPLRSSPDVDSAIAQAHNAIRVAQREADYVLVDAGSGSGPVTQAVLAERQSIVLVVDREYAAFSAVRDWTQRFMDLRKPRHAFSLLMVDRSGLDVSSFLDRMQLSFSFSVIGTVPGASEQLTWALEKQRPLVFLDRGDPYSKAMNHLVGDLTERAIEKAAAK